MRLSVFILILTSVQLHAQNCLDGSTSFRKQDYQHALVAFQKCLDTQPIDSSMAFMYGFSLLQLKKYRQAISFLKKSIELNYQPPQNAQFALSRSYAALDDNETSLKYLEKSVQNGFAGFPALDSADFDGLRSDKRFVAIQNEMRINAFPCLRDKNNTRFDFWVGDWDVFVGDLKRAESKISKAKGGCAILEDYTVLNGTYSGQSISYYDDTDKLWNQYWVGSGGDKSKYYEPHTYEGEADLQFITKFVNAQGVQVWTRMSYIQQDENTVLQNLDNSSDEGKSWTPGFRGVYKRKTK